MYPRKIYYFTESGQSADEKNRACEESYDCERENEYAAKIQTKEQAPAEDVTLF